MSLPKRSDWLVTIIAFTRIKIMLQRVRIRCRSTSSSFYDLSYCYIGVLGLAITVVVATIVSLCTGKMKASWHVSSYLLVLNLFTGGDRHILRLFHFIIDPGLV